MGPHVTKTYLDVLNSNCFAALFNNTHVVLILKVKSPRKLAYYRPISLCNVIYKFITKTLTNRLQRWLRKVVSESQNAFVLGWLISDNVIVAFELMHSMGRKNNGEKG